MSENFQIKEGDKVKSMEDIKSMYLDEIKAKFKEHLLPEYRAKQVYDWLSRGTDSFESMTNLPKGLRETLNNSYSIFSVKAEKKFESKIDGTIKYLFKLHDGELVEAVLMKYNHGYSMCISTQVGCKMDCEFCATGKSGFSRNLDPSEMLAQIQSAQNDNNIRVSNVVLMGMGEPLDNYENVLKFIRLLSNDQGMNVGMRHISLSTCGLVDKIYKLSDERLQLTLSVSLHAPTDEIRNQIMPINKRWNVKELIRACKDYVIKTKRRISFEYAMIGGLNDTLECADELSKLLGGMLCHVNLIPMNSVEESIYDSSERSRIERFTNILNRNKINVTVRRTLGSDISASCGQLRRSKAMEEKEG